MCEAALDLQIRAIGISELCTYTILEGEMAKSDIDSITYPCILKRYACGGSWDRYGQAINMHLSKRHTCK